MTKMNYNRPNWGYEKESWQDPTRGFSTHDYWKGMTKYRVINLNGHDEHPAEIKMVKYGNNKPMPVLWCNKCNKHIMNISKEDYKIYQNMT